jgi:hypothetical protein
MPDGNGRVIGDASEDGIRARPFSGIARERVSFLLPETLGGRVPMGMLTLLLGDPGLGKSLFTCLLAAQASREGTAVLMATAEDSPGATVRPRLEAVEADLGLIALVEMSRDGCAEGIALPDDIHHLERLVAERKATLVVIDPLMAHLPEKVNSWRDQSVRRALAPLARVAGQHNCAVVVIGHLNKDRGKDPLYRSGGSMGVPAAARSALLLARDPNDEDGERGTDRILAHVKCNVAPQAQSLTCCVRSTLLDGDQRISTARMTVTGTSEIGGSELLEAMGSEDERTERDDAADFLAGELKDGPKPVKELQAAAREAGISWRTLERSKSRLAKAEHEGFGASGRWVWRSRPQDRHGKDRQPHPSSDGDLSDLSHSIRDFDSSETPENPQDRHAGGMAVLDLDYAERLMEGESSDD